VAYGGAKAKSRGTIVPTVDEPRAALPPENAILAHSMVPVTYRPLLLYSRNNSLKKTIFLIPSNQTLPFHSRNKIVRGISDLIKTDRVINCDHLSSVRLCLTRRTKGHGESQANLLHE